MKNRRSPLVNWTRPRTLRCSTITWCLSAAFSASSRLLDLKGEATRFKRKNISATIVVDVKRFGHQIKRTRLSAHTRVRWHHEGDARGHGAGIGKGRLDCAVGEPLDRREQQRSDYNAMTSISLVGLRVGTGVVVASRERRRNPQGEKSRAEGSRRHRMINEEAYTEQNLHKSRLEQARAMLDLFEGDRRRVAATLDELKEWALAQDDDHLRFRVT